MQQRTTHQQVYSGLESSLGLEQRCVAYTGYLTKSPPLHKVKNRIARWHMRYFVLFDTHHGREGEEICNDIDHNVYLSYFKNYTSFKNGDSPLGTIELKKAVVDRVPPHTSVHGYPNAIMLFDGHRKYYLCSTQWSVSEAWYTQLAERLPHSLSPNFIWKGKGNRPDSGIVEEPHPSIWNKGSNPLPGTDKASLVLPSSISKISRIFGSEPESPFSGAADFFLNTPQQPPSPCPNCAARVHDTQKSSEMTSLMAISTNQYDDVDFDNGHWKLKASESIITNRGDDYDSESGISRTSSDSSTILPTPEAPPLPPRPIDGWRCRRKLTNDVSDKFQGPKMVFIPSMSIYTATQSKQDNNNNNNNRVGGNTNSKAKFKLKLSRAQSRSLDSIHGTLLDANVSMLFNEMTIDQLFPKIVECDTKDQILEN